MSGKQDRPSGISFRSPLEVDLLGSRITSDSGMLLVEGEVSEKLAARAHCEAGKARAAACRPALPLKLRRRSCNLRQRAYNFWEFSSKMEIHVEMFEPSFPLFPRLLPHLIG